MTRKLFLISSIALSTATLPATAQNLVDAARFSNKDIIGTARYRSMAGAFGALGGDPSSMDDNPAGIGIYRGTSELSITPNLAIARTNTQGTFGREEKQRDFSIANLSYIISFKPSNTQHLVNFNIGFGFNHSNDVKRRYQMTLNNPRSSFGAYLSNLTNNALLNCGYYNTPNYLETKAAWENANIPLLGLMAYDCYAIDDVRDNLGNSMNSGVISYDQANGLSAQQRLLVREENRMDEYNICAAANWDDFVYAGFTLSIVDFNSTLNSEIDEFYNTEDYTYYANDLETKGTGLNLKFGAIVKPTDAWRIGLAIHTPTWYEMKDIYYGEMTTNDPAVTQPSASGPYEYAYRFFSPWEYQFSTAYVFGNRALLSLEYDMTDYRSMKYKEDRDAWSDGVFDNTNDCIKDYMTEQHTFKVGAEVRATPQVSLRLGYAYQTSPFKDEVFQPQQRAWTGTRDSWGDDNDLIFSSSTKPNYSILDDTQFVTGGIGYRGKSWFIDLACIHRTQHEKVSVFPTNIALMGFDDQGAFLSPEENDGAVEATHVGMKTKTLSWDLTLGFRF